MEENPFQAELGQCLSSFQGFPESYGHTKSPVLCLKAEREFLSAASQACCAGSTWEFPDTIKAENSLTC